MSRRLRKKLGKDAPMKDTKEPRWSQAEFGLYAERIPRGIPMRMAPRIPVPVRSREGRMRWAIIIPTSWLVR